ncbi:hypothetical protein GL218_05477 [Daldinia childiae]|uniref:uncharacterized protein n=1 Tax=Daldinia childiae TaxID=326645 RepID=UPI0014469699|nr:uncharacterized protein GL218_05477 [Daldinia childiae]KAF3058160.1 hypothetical protein GL218_05477 [Daldinia childiae]
MPEAGVAGMSAALSIYEDSLGVFSLALSSSSIREALYLSNRRPSSLCQHDSEKSGSNIPAAQKGTNSSEPEYEDVPLAILTRGVQVSQPASNKPAATKKVTTERTGQDNQQGQSSTQGSQQQRRRATQAGPDGSESSEFTFRGGDTGNCVREPCGCCAYWINKICCGDDD